MRSNDLEVLSHTLERVYALSHLSFTVSSTQLNSNSCLVLWNHWETEANHEDVLLKESVRKLCCDSCISQPNWCNWTLVMTEDLESSCLHLTPEDSSVVVKGSDELLTFIQHFVCLNGSANNARGNRVREEVSSGFVSQHFNNFFVRGHKPS